MASSKWSAIVGFCFLPWYGSLQMTGVGALKSMQIPHDHLKRVLSKFIHEQSMVAINGC